MSISNSNLNILYIDLETKEHFFEEVTLDAISKYFGGRGLGLYDFYKNFKKNQLRIGFFVGPLSGILGVPSSNRIVSVTYTPYNNINYSTAGGNFSLAMRSNNLLGIVLYNSSDKDILLYIENSTVKIIDGSFLKNKKTSEKFKLIESKLKKPVESLVIGPAGEQEVIFSSIHTKEGAFGRTGHGYILGKMNVLGISLLNKKDSINIKYKKELFNFYRELVQRFKKNTVIQDLNKLGTFGMLFKRMDNIPYGYFERVLDKEKDINEKEILENFEFNIEKKSSCGNCFISCKKQLKNNILGFEYAGGFISFNALLKNFDFNISKKLVHLSDEYGMDSWSLGNILAYLVSNNIVNIEEIKENPEKIILKIINEEDFGKFAKKGVKELEKIYHNKGHHNKGLERGLFFEKTEYEKLILQETPRKFVTQVYFKNKFLDRKKTLTYKDYEETAYLEAFCDSAVMCSFTMYELTEEDYNRLIYYVTGLELSAIEIGKNVYNLHKKLNRLF